MVLVDLVVYVVFFIDYNEWLFLNSSGVTAAYFLKNLEKYELSEKLSSYAISVILISTLTNNLLASSIIRLRMSAPADMPKRSLHNALSRCGVMYSIAA